MDLRRATTAGSPRRIVPHPHEYFVPIDTLIVENGDKNPELQRLVAHAATRASFWSAAN